MQVALLLQLPNCVIDLRADYERFPSSTRFVGMPLISDPGGALVAAAVAEGHSVIPIPGPSAVLSALVGSGLPASSFMFCGFLPPKTGARIKAIEALAGKAGSREDVDQCGSFDACEWLN